MSRDNSTLVKRTFTLAGATVLIVDDRRDACRVAAERIAAVVASAGRDRGRATLGLATGATPIPVYERLVRLHRAAELSFRDVTTFNLDEYYPISPLDPRSYRAYMHRHLFGAVDLAPNRAHVLDGSAPEAFAAAEAQAFDAWIAAAGGLDLQLLGLGRNGHIGFNEPCDLESDAALALPTRLVDLDARTIADAAADFGGVEHVPTRALTMGVAPIVAARSIVVLAFGPAKAEAVARSLLGPMTGQVPGSLLQAAPGRVTWLLDPSAAAQLG